MPRIKKIKFENNGKDAGDTTFTNYITLDLMYDAKYQYFYFEREQILKHIKLSYEDSFKIDFRDCKTERRAVRMIEVFIGDNIYKGAKKYLAVFVFSNKAGNRDERSFEAVNVWGAHKSSGIAIGYSYYLKLIDPKSGETIMTEADKYWKVKSSSLHDASDRYSFLEWSENREAVLNNAMDRLNEIGDAVRDLFKTNIEQGTLEEFIDSQPLLLKNE